MNQSYLLGVFAAILAGMAYYSGIVLQKLAVSKLEDHSRLMYRLIRTPLWVEGFAIQFIIGVPLNLVAAALIGPAILPGLMATGLIALVIGSIRLSHEAFGWTDAAGILFVMGAAALLGFAGLGIDMKNVDFYDKAFLSRLVVFSVLVGCFSVSCFLLQRKNSPLMGIYRTLDAGFLFVQSNLWLSVMMGFLYRWGSGSFSASDLVFAIAATVIAGTGSILGVTETQRAFQVGDATRLVPIQAVPQQILPVITFFIVFQLSPSKQNAIFMAGVGVMLVLLGSTLLARRQVALQ